VVDAQLAVFDFSPPQTEAMEHLILLWGEQRTQVSVIDRTIGRLNQEEL
jgi:hypothetical protein